MTRIYGTAQWRRLRLLKLSIDPRCEPCSRRGLDVEARHVDHIVSIASGGAAYPPLSGLMSMCVSCHSIKTAARDRAGGKGVAFKGCDASGVPLDPEHPFLSRESCAATLVCGPPGSGKTSYVTSHRRTGDLVIDLDALVSALSGTPWYEGGPELLPFACEARDAVLARLRRKHSLRHAWVISQAPKLADRHPLAESIDARIIIFDLDAATCVQRIEADPRRPKLARSKHIAAVASWWSDYEAEPHTPLEGRESSAYGPMGELKTQLVSTRDWGF